MAHGHGVAAAVHAAPRLHRRPVGQAAFEDFIPTDHLAPVGFQVPTDLANEPRLQFMRVVQAFVGDAFLAFGALLPPHFGRLIASDVDVFRRKKLHHFVQHGFQKRQRRVLPRTVDVLEHAPVVRHLHGLAGAPQPRVGGQCGTAVAREFDFGNDLDVALGCVGDDVADLLFGVKPAVPAAVRLRPPCTLLGQFRIGINFNAPPLIFRQVPMQHAHFVQGKQVNRALDKFWFHEMPATIQQQSSVGKPRRISQLSARQGAITRQRQRTQRGQSVKHPVR